MRLKIPRPGHRASQMELSHRLPNKGRSTEGRYKAQMVWSPHSQELNPKSPDNQNSRLRAAETGRGKAAPCRASSPLACTDFAGLRVWGLGFRVYCAGFRV